MASVEKRKRGYRVHYRDPSGMHKAKFFRTSALARDFLHSVENSKRTGAYVDPSLGKVTLSEFFDYFRKNSPKPLRPTTDRGYESLFRLNIEPTLGNRTIGTIQRSDVTALLSKLRENKGEATVEHAYRLLRRVLNFAMFEDRIGRNPATGFSVRPPKPKEARNMTVQEVDALAAAMPAPYRALVLLGSWCGLRFSELAALRVRHLNYLRRRIEVSGAATDVNGHRHEGPTKTGRTRYVPVPSSVWSELVAHVERYGSKDPSAYIFTSPTGGPLRHRNFLRRVWDPAVERAKLDPPPTPHDMRHTAASAMADAGYSLVEAQHVLGHSTQYMTAQYTHLFPDKLEALTGKLDRAIAKARKSKGSGDVVRELRNG